MSLKKSEKKISVCPVGVTLKIIGGKWRLRIINELSTDRKRFGELKRLIPEISEKMLIQELKALAAYDIVRRKAYREIPPKVEYSLTEKGKKVLPILDEIKKFSVEIL